MRRFQTAAAVVWIGVCVGQAYGGAHGDNGCNTCHVPHKALPNSDQNAAGPLWAPQVSSKQLAIFTLYSSPTFDALGVQITQPDGSSKMCLCCHDGSYAGVAPEHQFGEGKAMTLSESHPISFRYDSSLAVNPKLHVPGSLRDPAIASSGLTPSGTIATDLLDENSKMQCSTCHDVHHSGLGTHHLRYNYESDGGLTMCRTCHNK
ncbi:MAG: hypothetical protein PHU85_05145 [Phycisphaerae bacterium]|nr:hypothetical protein [Phycisphaerae bacterium]